MTPDIEQTELMCAVCRRSTLQEASYAGRLLTHVTCTECGTVTRFDRGDLRDEYVADLRLRVRSKPKRLLHRMAKHPLRFLGSLPGAVFRQPKKFIRELRTVKADENPNPENGPGPQK